jgi:hypothetical protein
METEKIISTLKEQVGTTSLSDRTIADYVSENIPAEGTEPDEQYFARHAKVLKSLSGNFNSDIAAQVEAFKKNYKPTPPKPSPKPDPQPTNGIEDRLKAIEEGYKSEINTLKESLTQKEKALEQKSYVTQVESKFKAELEEKGLIYDPIYFEHIVRSKGDLDTAKSVDEAVKDVQTEYDKMFKDRNRNLTSSGFISDIATEPAGGASGTMSAAEQFKERMREQGWLPKKE